MCVVCFPDRPSGLGEAGARSSSYHGYARTRAHYYSPPAATIRARARKHTHTHTHTTRVPCIASPCCIGKVLLPARPARPAVTYPRSAWLANQLSAAAADAASDGGGGGGEEDGGSRSAEASEGAAATAAERGYAALAAAADWSPQWGTAAGEQEGRVQVCRSALQRKLRPLGSVVGAAFLLVKFPELHP